MLKRQSFWLDAQPQNRDGHPMITARHSSGDVWLVTVRGAVTTEHHVRVTPEDLERYGAGRSCEELLQDSFRFLLEREPNTSILSSFDLPLISHYFPEYDRAILKR
jgi:hypothetical protein